MSAATRNHRGASERGFTLIELMVAMMAGLLVISAAFLMSKGATRLFASETRLSTAQMNVRTAMDRLRADLQRVAYQSSANVVSDPLMCQPTTLGKIQGVRLQPHGTVYNAAGALGVNAYSLGSAIQAAVFQANALSPDGIIVQGNFATTDLYPTASISAGGAGSNTATIWLSGTDPSVLRLLSSGGTADSGAANAVAAAFPVNRLLRLTNGFGKSQYFVISSTTVSSVGAPATLTPQITINTTSPNVLSLPDGRNCGFSGIGHGDTVNSVQTYLYSLSSLATLNVVGADGGSGLAYTWAYPIGSPADMYKTDLVRTEIDVTRNDQPFADSMPELVAENIVDLAFAVSADTSPSLITSPTSEPFISVYDFADSTGYTLADDATLNSNTTTRPQRIRSMRVRVTGRNRDVDRDTAIDDGGPDLMRVQVPLTSSGASGAVGYARARTLNEEVFLDNQRGLTW
ncbi:MAG: PilW family protein [Polyangiales bacterium]